MKKILLVTYGGGHAKIIESIYKGLFEEGEYEIVLITLTAATQYFRNKGIDIKTISDYPYEINMDESHISKLMPAYEKNDDMTELEHKLYNSISIENLLQMHTFTQVKEVIEKFGRRAYLPVDFMMHVLSLERPDLLITTNSPRMERASLLAAKSLGIKSVNIEDLFAIKNGIDCNIDNHLGLKAYSGTYGDYIFVMQQLTKENLINYGIDEERIFVTGNPNFDELLKFGKDRLNVTDISLNQTKKKDTLLFLAQRSPYFDIIENELKRIVINNDLRLIIKLHPNQNCIYKNSEYVKYTKDSLHENIMMSNLVITENSTAGLEALLLGKKLLSIQQNSLHLNMVPFDKFDNSILIRDINKLEDSIKLILNKENIKKNMPFTQDFNSTKKILMVINKILR